MLHAVKRGQQPSFHGHVSAKNAQCQILAYKIAKKLPKNCIKLVKFRYTVD